MVALWQFELGKLWDNISKINVFQGWFILGILFVVGSFFLAYKKLVPGTISQASQDKVREDTVGVLKTEVEELKTKLEKEQQKLESPEVLRARAATIEREMGIIKSPVVSEGRLLLVEDFDDAREMMSLWLQAFGYDVETAESGQKALKACEVARKTQPFDLIILDLLMPEMDGEQVVRELRKREDGTRVVILTAAPQSVNLEEMAKLDVLDVWRKPPSRVQLQKDIRKILG